MRLIVLQRVIYEVLVERFNEIEEDGTLSIEGFGDPAPCFVGTRLLQLLTVRSGFYSHKRFTRGFFGAINGCIHSTAKLIV